MALAASCVSFKVGLVNVDDMVRIWCYSTSYEQNILFCTKKRVNVQLSKLSNYYATQFRAMANDMVPKCSSIIHTLTLDDSCTDSRASTNDFCFVTVACNT